MISVPILGMHRPILRGERESEYGFPSQGTAPISPLFSRAQFLVCFGAGQQDSSGYSLQGGNTFFFNIRHVGKWVFIFPRPSSSRVPTGAHIRDSRQIPSLYAPLRDQGM